MGHYQLEQSFSSYDIDDPLYYGDYSGSEIESSLEELEENVEDLSSGSEDSNCSFNIPVGYTDDPSIEPREVNALSGGYDDDYGPDPISYESEEVGAEDFGAYDDATQVEETLLRSIENPPATFSSFDEFFGFVQKTNVATSIAKPSTKLSRSLRFSGHTLSAEKFDRYMKGYMSAYVSPGKNRMSQQVKEAKGRDWNEEFQTLVELPDSRIKFLGLRNLAHDFVYAAETYGKIIISEHCLPHERKTIPPVDVGGIAGGLKFICQGILFKFAIDYSGMYRGDENAMKAASHELKGLTHYFHCGIEELHVPLIAFIDYRGFRVIALSLLPIGSNTLCYGSADAGKTVYSSNSEMNSIAEKIGKALNLKNHAVGKKLIWVYGPADIEGHLGKDDRFYMLDFARVSPPQPPIHPGEQLYNLWRMEFVTTWKTPLCSDTFTGLGTHNKIEHVKEIRDAFKVYKEKVLPEVALYFDQNLVPPNQILHIIHSKGVNARHLGLVRSLVTSEENRQSILVECVARCVKSHLNSLLRAEMQKSNVPSEKPFRQVVLDLFNLIIGNSTFADIYWKIQMTEALEAKYASILSTEQLKPNFSSFSLFDVIPKIDLFQRIQELTKVVISAEAQSEMRLQPTEFEFVETDIELHSRIVHLNLIDFCDGMALYYEAENRTSNPKTQLRLMSLAQQRLERSLSQSGNGNIKAYLQYGNITRSLAMKTQDPIKKQKCFAQAASAFKKITEMKCDEKLHFQSLYLWAKTIWSSIKKESNHKEEEVKLVLELIEKARTIRPKEVCTITLSAKIYFQLGILHASNPKMARNYFMKALDITNDTTLIPVPGDCLLMLAKLQFQLTILDIDEEVLIGKEELKQNADLIQQIQVDFPDVLFLKNIHINETAIKLLIAYCFYQSDISSILYSALEAHGPDQRISFTSSFLSFLPGTTHLPKLIGNSNINNVIFSSDMDYDLIEKIVEEGELEEIIFSSCSLSLPFLTSMCLVCGSRVKKLMLKDISVDTEGSPEFFALPASLVSFSFDCPDMNLSRSQLMSMIGSFPSSLVELELVGLSAMDDAILFGATVQLANVKTLILKDCLELREESTLCLFQKVVHLNVRGCSFSSSVFLHDNRSLPSLSSYITPNGFQYRFGSEATSISIEKLGAGRTIYFRAPGGDVCAIHSNYNSIHIQTGNRNSHYGSRDKIPECEFQNFAKISLGAVGTFAKLDVTFTESEERFSIMLKRNGLGMVPINVTIPYFGENITVRGTYQSSMCRFDCQSSHGSLATFTKTTHGQAMIYVKPEGNWVKSLLPIILLYLVYCEKL